MRNRSCKKNRWMDLSRSAAVLLLSMLLSTQVYADSLENVQQDKNQAENDKSKAEQILQQLESEKSDLAVYIGDLDNQVSELQGKIVDLNARKDELESEILTKQEDIEKIREQEEQQYADMCARIQFMYVNSSGSYALPLFSAESMNDILNDSEYASALTRYDYNMLDQLAKTRQSLADAEAGLEQDLAEIEQVTDQVQEEEDTVNDLLVAKQEEMEVYNQEIANQEQLVAQYDAEIQAAASQIEAIEAAMRAEEEERKRAAEEQKRLQEEERKRQEEEQRKQEEQTTSSDTEDDTEDSSTEDSSTEESSTEDTSTEDTSTEDSSTEDPGEDPPSNAMVWPVPSSYKINSPFGRRESDGGVVTANHYGIDIGCPDGTPVVAAADGVVVLAQYSSTAGNWIIISHGNGMYTIYMHASVLYVSAGQRVNGGDTIMLSGATGATQGRHLHFEIRVGGYISSAYSVNPMNYY